jgi:16S rRNA G527 N7-methylase RsmG
VEELNLTNRVKVLCQRVEQVQLKSKLISCRALTSISDFLKMTHHLGAPDSRWWLLKAKNETINQELVCVDQSKWSVKIYPLIHPTQDVTRNLVEVERKK